jgi:phenylacetate-CoA ligase
MPTTLLRTAPDPSEQSHPKGSAGVLAGMALLLRIGLRRAQFEKSCRWSRSELERQQAVRLAAMRHHAVSRSPFYARFHRGQEGRPLDELPILTKAALMANFDEVVTDPSIRLREIEHHLQSPAAQRLYRGRYVALATSGSTGRRGVFVFDRREWIDAIASLTRPIAWGAGAAGLRRPPRSALIASATPWHYSARIGASLDRVLPTLRLDAGLPLPALVARLNAWRPEALAAYPSVLIQLADEQIAGRLDIPLARIATSAEVLTAETRRRVAQAWGIRVQNTYGATEYAPIASECEHGSLHLFEDGAVIEIVDERGQPVPDGARGDRVLLTVLGRRTQPLIRYEISDMLRPVGGECPCGRKFRIIEAVEGRLEDVLRFAAVADPAHEVPIHPNLLHDVLETVDAAGWQVVHDDGGLTVNLLGDEATRAGTAVGTAGARIAANVAAMLAARGVAVPPIRVVRVDHLQRGATGKTPLIVARRAPQ